MFHPSEVELASTTRSILADVERLKPTSVVLDSLSELRLLAGSALRYRRQILALKQFFATRQCTVLLLDDLTATDRDLQVQSIAHGVVLLEQLNPEYGSERRRLRVVKYRGVQFRGGYHDYVIRKGGIEVFPRLVAAEHRQQASREKLGSDIPEFDLLLGGGIEEGTSTLIVGAAGTGKSTLGSQFAAAAAARGQHVAQFLFDESLDTLLSRCDALQVNLREHVEAGTVSLQQIDPAELTPGEFTHAIRRAVESRHAKVIIIDSLNGYLNATPEERFLTIQLHELLMYLEPEERGHDPDRGAPGADRRADEYAGGCQLSGGCGCSSALLRGPRRGSTGHFGDEEARQQARAHDPGVPIGSGTHRGRRDAAGLPRDFDRCARLRPERRHLRGQEFT